MNWKKFFYGVIGRDVNENEEETDTDDDEITESSDAESRDKSFRIFGVPFYKLSYKHLSNKCLKVSFVTINIVTFLAGVVATVTSAWLFVDNKIMSRLVCQRLFATILFLFGTFVSCAAFIGIFGSMRKLKRFMTTYIVLYSIFLGIIFLCAILSFWLFETITKKVQDDMAKSIGSYRSSDWAKVAWDTTQRNLRCCGVKSSKDWMKYRINIPRSCCSIPIKKCSHVTESLAYKTGCLRNGVRLLKSYIHIVMAVFLVVFVILILSMFFALGVRYKLKRRNSGRSK